MTLDWSNVGYYSRVWGFVESVGYKDVFRIDENFFKSWLIPIMKTKGMV